MSTKIKGYDIPCEIIEDLLPSYMDKLTQDKTSELIANHLDSCEVCRGKYNRMVNPFAEESRSAEENTDKDNVNEREKKEIDFLRKTRKNNRKWILIWAAVIWLIAVVVIGYKYFLLGNDMNTDYLAYNLQVNGAQMQIYGQATSETGIQRVEITEIEGIVEVSVRGVQKSFFYSKDFDRTFTASEPIRQVWIGDRIIWADGQVISPITANLLDAYNPYVGNMPGNGKVVSALNIQGYLGNFTNELQTTEEPYGWKLISSADFAKEREADLETRLKSYAYILLADIGNLGEVTFTYSVDGEPKELTLAAAEATSYAGCDIKEVGENVVLLEQLVRKTGLDSHVINSGAPLSNTEVDPAFAGDVDSVMEITVINFAEDEIYGLSIQVEADGVSGRQAMQTANHTPLGNGENINFQLIKEDFTGAINAKEGSVKVTCTDKDGNTYEAQGEITIDMLFGTHYRINLGGNANDGYLLGR